MAVTVTAPLATPVVSGVTLQAGGSLTASTTYYFRIIADDGLNFEVPLQKLSAPSAEGTFTTDTTNKSCKVDWGAVTGATRYTIYLTTTSGDYSGNKRIVVSGSAHQGTTTANTTYTIDGTVSLQLPNNIFASNQIPPFGINKEAGKIHISFTGTTTLQDIYDAVIAAGYTGNIYYDGTNFALYGVIAQSGTTTSSLTVLNHSIFFIQWGISNKNVNCTITFGQSATVGSLTYGQNGCNFFILGSYYSTIDKNSTGIIRFYGCVFKAPAVLTTPSIDQELWMYGSNPEMDAFGQVSYMDCKFLKVIFGDYTGSSDITVHDLLFGLFATGNYYRPTLVNYNMAPYNTFTAEIHIYSPTIYRGAGYTTSTNEFITYYRGNYPVNVHNGSFPGKTTNIPCIKWWWLGTGVYFKFWNTLDLQVVDANGTGISGATVTITDLLGSAVAGSPLTTDANGNITQIDLYAYKMEADGAEGNNVNSTITYYTTHTVVISKTGYTTRTVKYLMTQKRVEVEKLTQDGTDIIGSTLYGSTIY